MQFKPLTILFFALLSFVGAVEPTGLRIWTSKNGTKIVARASEMTENVRIQLVTKDGRDLTLGIDEFSEKDQLFLEIYFKKKQIQFVANAGTLEGPVEAGISTSISR